MQTLCKQCGSSFSVPPNKLAKGQGLFCSVQCSALGQRKRVPKPSTKPTHTCSWCGGQFSRNAKKVGTGSSGLAFCSRSCKDTAQRLDGLTALHPSHYGSGSPHNYRLNAIRNLAPVCSVCGYHTHPEILEVHHIDGDRSNNTLSNLTMLCPTCHTAHHFITKSGKWRNSAPSNA
jgi:5-methylcytosine-specific restriction endonuclease McrA